MTSPHWRDNCGDRLHMFINDEKYSDTLLQFGSGSSTSSFTLNCHYVVLALNSERFRNSIDSYPFKDGKRLVNCSKYSQTEQAVIADIILSFYNGLLSIHETNFDVVYRFSKEYGIPWIEKQALVDLHTFVSEDNVVRFIKLSEEVHCKILRGDLMKYLVQTRLADYRKVITDVQILSPETLKVFLKATKQLDNRPEHETLQAVLVWMGSSVVKLSYVKKLFGLICWERLAQSERLVEELSAKLRAELFPKLTEDQQGFVAKCLQDAANFAACAGTMENAHSVFATSRWTAFPFELAEFVLPNEYINVTNEYVIAEALIVWLESQEQDKITKPDLLSLLSAVRLDELHSIYILKHFQPYLIRLGVSQSEWNQVFQHPSPQRKLTDHTVSGSVVTLTLPPKKPAKELLAYKSGTYTLTGPCKCSYLRSGGTVMCLSVTVTVSPKSSPPVMVKHSQCRFCNRVVLHFFCGTADQTSPFPALICGNAARIREVLRAPNLKFHAVLSEAEDRSGAVRKTSWYKTPITTVLRTLSNDNITSLTEYELLEAALDWLDFRMPDKTYQSTVLSCIRFENLHEEYLNDVLIRYLKNHYFMKSDTVKNLSKGGSTPRRVVPLQPCYKKILSTRVPMSVVELRDGEHHHSEPCLCEVSSVDGDLRPGVLDVTFTVRVKDIPALRITARCSKCNVSLRHGFLRSSSKSPYYLGLATASVYRLREIFRVCLQDLYSDDSDDLSSPATPSSASECGTFHRSSSREFHSLVPRDKLWANLILGP